MDRFYRALLCGANNLTIYRDMDCFKNAVRPKKNLKIYEFEPDEFCWFYEGMSCRLKRIFTFPFSEIDC